MGFALNPNGSDHNGIDDTVERTEVILTWLVGPYCEDRERGPLPVP